MDRIGSLNHTKWDCKYHVVFIPKKRRKVLYGQLRVHLGEVFRTLAQHKESRIEEGHVMRDHVHMLIAIPPKYAVSKSWGISRGKRDAPGAGVWGEQEELYRAELLGARVLCLHGGAGCADDPELHPAPGRGGRSTGAARSVEVRCHRCGGAKSWGRVSVPV